MSIYKPSELLQFLKSLGISPKKSLSQNFLLDQNIIKKIIKTADVSKGDSVLEIGPGPGSLTEALLNQGADVIAVEKDQILAKALERLQVEDRLHIYCEDIMKFPLTEKIPKNTKVIANLPYHLTTPILTTLLPMRHLFSKIVVMVQDEVAIRFTAEPGNKDYSSISIFLQYYSTPNYAFQVSRNCFFPKPKVQSAVVEFTLHTPPKVSDEKGFFQLVRKSFQQRRKMLRSSVKNLYPSIEQALEELGLNPKERPENLSLKQFIALFEKVKIQT